MRDGIVLGLARASGFRRRAPGLLVAALLAVQLLPAAGAPAQKMVDGIRVDEVVEVELQQIYVTVSDASGRVLDLERDDFSVRDRGRPQEIVTFARGDIPFTAVLLVDASGSMSGERLQLVTQGAAAFAKGMTDNDEAKVMLASDRLLVTTPFSRDPAELMASLGQVEAGRGTAFRDQLYLALLLLEQRQGRRVVVVLSDGWDAHSVVGEDDLARLARRSQALIYWVRITGGEAVRGRAATGEGAGTSRFTVAPLSAWRDARTFYRSIRQLHRVVQRSGGRVETVPDAAAVVEGLRGILRELREQYALGYYPDPTLNDGSWREVKVDVGRSGLRLRAREGYVDR